MLGPVPDEAFVRQAKSEHLACWWGGLVGGGAVAGKGQEKGEMSPSQQCWEAKGSAHITGTGS